MAQKVGDFDGAILAEGPAFGHLAAPILRRRVGQGAPQLREQLVCRNHPKPGVI